MALDESLDKEKVLVILSLHTLNACQEKSRCSLAAIN